MLNPDLRMIKPKSYEYLWTDYEVNFIFTSCYLFPCFRKNDIVLIYDWKNKGLMFFLSKNDSCRLAEEGIDFIEKGFADWKKDILKNIKKGKELVSITKGELPVIHSMTGETIKQRLIERFSLFQKLGGNYFYTEYFVLAKAEKMPKLSSKLEELSKLKFMARAVLNEFYNYNRVFAPYITEISKRTNNHNLEWLSHEEIIDVLDGKNIADKELCRKYWLFGKKTGWNLVIGAEAESLMKSFNDYFFPKYADNIKGIIANKGIIKGRVKIIRTLFSDGIADEIKKVKQGDILVAETTGPDIIVACRCAGAIVTDEGGLTSHAAIVSREFGIPCIVGTKFATKVLKDNDIVEVDANKGTVQRITQIRKL